MQIGASQDVQIYHDGSNSYFANTTGATLITGSGAGNIAIKPNSSEDSILAVPNGNVQLYYDGSKKLETSSIGISVTGNVNATNHVQVNDGKYLYAGNSGDLGVTHSGTHGFINNQTGDLSIQSDGNLKLERKDGGEDYIHCAQDAQVELHYNGSVKFRTQSYGASVGNPVGDTLSGVDTITQFYTH